MQVIYSYDLAGISEPSTQDIHKALQNKFTKTGHLLYYLIQQTVDIAKYVEIYSNNKANKHITTHADLNVNIKLAGNNVIWGLLENKSYNAAISGNHIDSMVDQDLVKRLFLQLESSETYKNYIENNSRTNEEDAEIMKFIFNDLILNDELNEASLNEQFQNYDDDIEMLHGLIMQTFDQPKKPNFTRLLSPDKNDYAKKIVETFYEKQSVSNELIFPKLKNWDPERVAKLDMILLQMGICEFLYFETIPVKVTINEYIDLAKDYSTPQSGQFVNGLLDNIHKDLLTQDRLQKVDFRKM